MVERILQLMKDKNLTPSQFADEIGIQRSGMSHLISGRNKPSLEFVMKVLQRYPDVKPEYLLYGTAISGQIEPEGTAIPGEAVSGSSSTLFDQPGISDLKPESKPQKAIKRERPGKKIEKIVVFYDDRTYREYEPE